MLIASVVIAVLVVVFLLIATRIRKGMMKYDAFFTQVKFIQMYMNNTTQKQLYNIEVDDAMSLGQDILWEAAEDFNNRMHKAIIEGKPIPIGDMGIITSSIKIIKAAEAMVFIKKNGPIYEDVEVVDGNNDDAA